MAKSMRITKQLKYSIMNKAVDWKFTKADADNKAFEGRVAEVVFNELFPAKVRAILAELPDWMVVPEAARITLDDAVRDVIDPKNKMFLGTYRYSDINLNFPEGVTHRTLALPLDNVIPKAAVAALKPTTLKLLTEFLVEKFSIQKRREDFREKLDSLLDQMGTTAKLVEVMPEAEEWLPEVYQCSNIPQADAVADLLKI